MGQNNIVMIMRVLDSNSHNLLMDAYKALKTWGMTLMAYPLTV